MYKVIKICLIILILSSCGQKYSGKKPPIAQKGVLDLSGWNFEEDGPIDLKGQWKFYWKKFIDPKAIQENKEPKEDGYIEVPGPWTSFKKEISPLGYASYILKIKGLEKGKNLAMSSGDLFSNYVMYKIEKGSIVPFFEVGKVGHTKATSIPQFKHLKGSLLPKESSLDFLVKVSNFRYRNGEFNSNFKLGLRKDIFWDFDTARYIDFLVLGMLLFIFLYHIGSWGKRKEDKTSLYFGLFCGILFLRKISLSYYLSWFFPTPSIFMFEIEAKINFLSLVMMPPIFSHFLNQLFQNQLEKFSKFITYPSFVLGPIIIFFPAKIYSQIYFLLICQLLTLITLIYIYFKMATLTFKGLKFSTAIFTGINIIFIGIIHDLLIPFQLTSPPEFSPFLFFFFILIQTYILLSKFSNAF
ncbi:MAG: 7TM diverse intracellular signaling domain-containing protein, partial [Bdellovibrionota bacterium]|nr:7TM diverse intracellular signaling domain-containing protein [Bdellovibrionota bacterium]